MQCKLLQSDYIIFSDQQYVTKDIIYLLGFYTWFYRMKASAR